eukprot:scaffold56409_cov66-Phaeocystis_antarctica.AAC.4
MCTCSNSWSSTCASNGSLGAKSGLTSTTRRVPSQCSSSRTCPGRSSVVSARSAHSLGTGSAARTRREAGGRRRNAPRSTAAAAARPVTGLLALAAMQRLHGKWLRPWRAAGQ